jgi:hypothetical protein
MLEGKDEYEVEQILDHHRLKVLSPFEYPVCWLMYASENETWKPEAYLKNALYVLKEC